MRKLIKQFVRHMAVGGTAFLIDYGLLIVFTEVAGFHYLVSATLSFIISLVFNYRFSVRFVFKRRKDISWEQEFLIFLILSAIGLAMNTVLLWFLVRKGHIHYLVSKLIAAAIVTVYNFFSRKRFLEKQPWNMTKE